MGEKDKLSQSEECIWQTCTVRDSTYNMRNRNNSNGDVHDGNKGSSSGSGSGSGSVGGGNGGSNDDDNIFLSKLTEKIISSNTISSNQVDPSNFKKNSPTVLIPFFNKITNNINKKSNSNKNKKLRSRSNSQSKSISFNDESEECSDESEEDSSDNVEIICTVDTHIEAHSGSSSSKYLPSRYWVPLGNNISNNIFKNNNDLNIVNEVILELCPVTYGSAYRNNDENYNRNQNQNLNSNQDSNGYYYDNYYRNNANNNNGNNNNNNYSQFDEERPYRIINTINSNSNSSSSSKYQNQINNGAGVDPRTPLDLEVDFGSLIPETLEQNKIKAIRNWSRNLIQGLLLTQEREKKNMILKKIEDEKVCYLIQRDALLRCNKALCAEGTRERKEDLFIERIESQCNAVLQIIKSLALTVTPILPSSSPIMAVSVYQVISTSLTLLYEGSGFVPGTGTGTGMTMIEIITLIGVILSETFFSIIVSVTNIFIIVIIIISTTAIINVTVNIT